MLDVANQFSKEYKFPIRIARSRVFRLTRKITVEEIIRLVSFVIDETRKIIHNAVDEKFNAGFLFGNEPSLMKYRYDRTAPRTQLNARDIYKLSAIPSVCEKQTRHLYILIGSLEI